MWRAQHENIPPSILKRYGSALTDLQWIPVTNGFSGADVWRGEDANQTPKFALKRWPSQTTTARLAQIHSWMKQVEHFSCVPAILHPVEEGTIVQLGDRAWDVAKWLPGHSLKQAGEVEVVNACHAVAELHAVWSRDSKRAPCPGIQRRIEVLMQWLSCPDTPIVLDEPSLIDLIPRARAVVQRIAPLVLRALRPWGIVPMQIHPCIRDLRGEHLLYSGECVTGIVDFGAMDVDSPAIDLARLLGDLAGENEQLFALGLNRYHQLRPDINVGERFVRLLDWAGVSCSIVGWFVRLSRKSLQIPAENVKNRLTHLVARAERFKPF